MLIAILTLTVLSFILTTLLIVAFKKLHVEENPLYEEVEKLLPHANCGACGFAGCRAFAEALVDKKTQPAKCTVSSEEEKNHIADYLGVAAGFEEKKVARLACAGGSNGARRHANYQGQNSQGIRIVGTRIIDRSYRNAGCGKHLVVGIIFRKVLWTI